MLTEELAKIEELTKKNDEGPNTLSNLKSHHHAPSSTSQESSEQKIVFLPTQRWLKKFSGQRTAGEQTVNDFIEELNVSL